MKPVAKYLADLSFNYHIYSLIYSLSFSLFQNHRSYLNTENETEY